MISEENKNKKLTHPKPGRRIPQIGDVLSLQEYFLRFLPAINPIKLIDMQVMRR